MTSDIHGATAFVIGPSLSLMQDGNGGRETVLILAPAYQVLALMLATGRARADRTRAMTDIT